MTENKEKIDDIFSKIVVEDPDFPNFKWYLVQTQSNCEKKAVANINVIVELNNLEEKIKHVLVPAVEVVELKRDGSKRKVMKKLYPNYILVFADMNEDVCSHITRANKVLGFLNKTSSNLIPKPIPNHEVKNMIEKIKGYSEDKASLLSIKEGDSVRIIKDMFEGHIGLVNKLNIENGTAKVLINILGRDVDFQVNLKNIEKYTEAV